LILHFVDSGRFAQHTAAPEISGAATVGETNQNRNEAAQVKPRSNRESLLASIREFFQNNPGLD
jgi:hypothetical protein